MDLLRVGTSCWLLLTVGVVRLILRCRRVLVVLSLLWAGNGTPLVQQKPDNPVCNCVLWVFGTVMLPLLTLLGTASGACLGPVTRIVPLLLETGVRILTNLLRGRCRTPLALTLRRSPLWLWCRRFR